MGLGTKGGASHQRSVRRTAAEEGQALAEYALILGLVTAGLILGFSSLGTTTVNLFNAVLTAWQP